METPIQVVVCHKAVVYCKNSRE